eukprot:PhM_4_TR16957/c0_g1_i1/m.74455/K12795/SUGT1, SGT1; suppressor of G2 allele of SKP1
MSSLEEVETLFKSAQSLFGSHDYKAASEALRRCRALAGIIEPTPTELISKVEMWTRKVDTHLQEEQAVATKQQQDQQQQQSRAPSVRHEFFQTLSNVTLTFYIKNCADSDVTASVQAEGRELHIKIKDHDMTIGPLYGRVESDLKITVKSMKIEVVMTKTESMNWGGLLAGATGNVTSAAPVAAPTTATVTAKRHVKDWSKEKIEDEDDKLDGDQALQACFRNIYSQASDEARMAMMKSFQESGGTVLSTNWQDVGSRTVEAQAPKGMEAKQWGKE